MIVTLKPGERLQVFAAPGHRLDYQASSPDFFHGLDIVVPDVTMPALPKRPPNAGPKYERLPGAAGLELADAVSLPDSLGG